MSDCTDSHSPKVLRHLPRQDPLNGHEDFNGTSPILGEEDFLEEDSEVCKASAIDHQAMSAALRCLALEQAYVHEVYTQIARECGACSPVRSHIKDFVFQEFEFGSILLDVGCGDGKYLHINAGVYTVGLERCPDWFDRTDEEEIIEGCYSRVPSFGDYLLGDVIHIPFRDEFLDGILCCGVLHHISTTERRIRALNQIARLLKIGGKVLITVWAFEGRELGSQDVLIKWTNGLLASKGRNSKTDRLENSAGRGVRFRAGHGLCSSSCSCTHDLMTTTDDFDDETSSSSSSCSTTTTTYVNRRAAYESCNSPTSEFGTCYSFVKKALLKFNLSPASFYYATAAQSTRRTSRSSTAKNSSTDAEDIPIELPNNNIEDQLHQHPLNPSDNEIAIKSSSSSPTRLSNHSFSSKEGSPRKKKFDRKNSLLESGLKLITAKITDSPSKGSLKEHYGSLVSLVRDRIWNRVKVSTTSDHKESKSSSSSSFAAGNLNPLRHRFSLPVVTQVKKMTSRQGSNDSTDSYTILSVGTSDCPEDKVCSHSILKKTTGSRHPRIDEVDSRQESLELTERTDESTERDDELGNLSTKVNRKKMFNKKSSTRGIVLQKSLSSDSLDSKQSRQQSFNTTEESTSKTTTTTTTNSISCSTNCSLGSRMVAYYSMPELRALEETSPEEECMAVLRGRRSRPRISDLHPITFLEEVEEVSLPRSKEVKRESSQDTEAAVDEMENMFHSIEIINSKCSSSMSNYEDVMTSQDSRHGKDRMQLTLPSKFYLHPKTHTTQEESDALLNQTGGENDYFEDDASKKTQRSSSVEYKAKISPSYREKLRRFSASPSLLVPKTFVHFFQEENLHETHPSVDSEESFVTIIPANERCRGSLAFDGSEGSYYDDVMLDVDNSILPSPDETGFGENSLENFLTPVNLKVPAPSRATGNLSNGSSPGQSPGHAGDISQPLTSNPPSEAYSDTSGTSTPEPPAELHRYFHLFRCGELEDLISNNVHNLRVLRSYYSEHATSWCIICDKIQVSSSTTTTSAKKNPSF